MISLVVPCYNEGNTLKEFYNKLINIILNLKIKYEIIFIDDGSKDLTWEVIEEMFKKDQNIKGIKFTRNFGKESAIYAGLAKSKGDCCIIIDADLQHPPELIPEMINLWKKDNYKVIQCFKKRYSKESIIRKFGAKIFYRILSSTTYIDIDNATDFMLLDRIVVNKYLKLIERNLFLKGLIPWFGFKIAKLYFECQEGLREKSTWNTLKLINQGISAVTSFTSIPLQIVTILGFFTFIISFILSIQTLIKKFSGSAVEGFTTVIILILFIGSTIMISLGIIGIYIGKIYDEIKKRPRYNIEKEINKDLQ